MEAENMALQPNQAGSNPEGVAVNPKGKKKKEKRNLHSGAPYAPNVPPEQYWDFYYHRDGTQNFDKKAAGSVPVGSPVPLAYMLPKHPKIGVKHQWILEREKAQKTISEPSSSSVKVTVNPLLFSCSIGSGLIRSNNEPELVQRFG